MYIDVCVQMQRMAHARLVALAPEDESIDELGPNSKDGEVIDSANQQQENELYMQQQQAATAVIEAVHDAYKPAQQRVCFFSGASVLGYVSEACFSLCW